MDLALIVDMDSKKNDKLDPTTVDGQRAESAGLSSAMHDIRMLANRYQSESQAEEAGDSLHLAGVTSIQPQQLLQPVVQTSSDRWKGPAFWLLMLLGLSTSALALSLFAEPETLDKPVYFHVEEPTLNVSQAVLPAQPSVLPYEEPRYETSQDSSSDDAVAAPPAAGTARKSATPKSSARVQRSVSSPLATETASTCDEVACLIDSSDPCCSQYASVAQRESILEATRPYRPERAAVMKAMKGIEADVLRCFETHGETGILSVDFVIAADGHVTGVELEHGTLGFRACVRDQVSTVSFEPLQAPFKMSFPFRK